MRKLYISIILSLLAILQIGLYAADLSKYDLNEQGSTSSSNPDISDFDFESIFLMQDDPFFGDNYSDIPLALQNEEQLSDLAIQRMHERPIDKNDEEQLVDIEMIDTPTQESPHKTKKCKGKRIKAARIKRNSGIQAKIRALVASGKTLTEISNMLKADHYKKGIRRKTIAAWLDEQDIPYSRRTSKIASKPEIQMKIRKLFQKGKSNAQIVTILQNEFGPEGLSKSVVSAWIRKNIIRSQEY